MAKIDIELSTKSLKNAIRKLESIKVDSLITAYLIEALKWLRNRADWYLLSANMDGNVIAEIMGGWQGEISRDTARLINTNEKAVFVEFGVGRVAENDPHPNANEAHYEYNVQPPQGQKLPPDNRWYFSPDGKIGIDLQVGYYNSTTRKNGKEWIKTTGSPPTMYLYHASRDFFTSGAYKQLWANVLENSLKRL